MRYITDFWTAAKQPRLDIDEAVDAVLPLAIAQKFRERLTVQQRVEASTSHEDAEKRKPSNGFNLLSNGQFVSCNVYVSETFFF